jgi:hypothetical protein
VEGGLSECGDTDDAVDEDELKLYGKGSVGGVLCNGGVGVLL